MGVSRNEEEAASLSLSSIAMHKKLHCADLYLSRKETKFIFFFFFFTAHWSKHRSNINLTRLASF